MPQTIMAVGAHADDVEINLGGTLSKYLAHGYELVYVMSTNNMSGQVNTLMPDGSKSATPEPADRMMARRKAECDATARELGTSPIHLDHPQRHYYDDSTRSRIEVGYGQPRPEFVPPETPTILTAHEHEGARRRVTDLIHEHQPEAVFTHGLAQIDMEHVGTALLVTRAFWQAVEEGYNGSLLHWREHHAFLGEVNMRWETYVDYTGHVDRKMELIGVHDCQMPNWRQPDFPMRRRAHDFGAICGCRAAELFTWVRRADHGGNCRAAPPYGPLTRELFNHNR